MSRRTADEPTDGAALGVPSCDVLLDLHRRMVAIRVFEEVAGELMESGRVPGALHLYVGQEAVAAGTMAQLRDEDQITSTHRGHGHLIAKGGQYAPMFAELFGKQTGSNRGRGGSMHISDISIGMLGANGIVGAGAPIAVGAAFANQFLGTDHVAVSFFGDGASNAGAVHEAANLAAVWRLPVLFVCENNSYAEFTPQSQHQAVGDVATRAEGWGMPGVVVDGMDVVEVWRAAGTAVDRARTGGGPTLIECKTYRFYDHVGVKGMRIPYRTESEEAAWRLRDPIEALERTLVQDGHASADDHLRVREQLADEAQEAVAAAEGAPRPAIESLLDDVYSVVVP